MSQQIPDEQGRLRVVTVANPGAGLDVAIVQDARVRWKVLALRLLYVADANVANRAVELVFTVGGLEVMRIGATTPHVAGLTRIHQWYMSDRASPQSGSTVQNEHIPIGLLINNGTTISTDTGNIQVGDQISDVRMMVEEWIEPLV